MTEQDLPPKLTLTRQGTRSYTAVNQRGATINIGDGPGEWTPGDLLKLALAGCNAMSADVRLARALGEDFPLEAHVSGTFDQPGNRYTSLLVELEVDTAALDADETETLRRRTRGAIERNCTIARSLQAELPHHTTMDGRELL